MISNVKDVVKKNEVNANRNVAKVMFATFFIFIIVYLLNIARIFIIDHKIMNVAFISSSIILLLPTLLNKIFSPENRCLKYIYVFLASLFTFIVTITLTRHVIVIYCYPIALSGLYFSRKMIRCSSIMAITIISIGQIIAFHLYGLVVTDKNFPSFHDLILFGTIPNILSMLSLATLFDFLTKMTTNLLEEEKQSINEIQLLNEDIISGFATLVESRDENTGGHVKRTSRYVELIVNKLMEDKLYSEILDPNMAENIVKAAPMHDIGKISVSDAILQKPGKLTDEEYEEIKKHTVEGGKIIKETFHNVEDEEFRKVVFDVARHHHEKWNGKGYPDKLKGEEIPLSARIMAVADVFDAVSQKRCYREAMPLSDCFEIISKGSGSDFDPAVAEAFLNIKSKIQETIKEI